MSLIIGPWITDADSRYPGNQIAGQYRTWDSAFVRQDVYVLGNVLSTGFRIVSSSGNVTTRDSYLVTFKDDQPPKKYKTALHLITHRSNKAEAWTKESVVTQTGDVRYHWYVDTWIFEQGEWRLLTSKTLREKHD